MKLQTLTIITVAATLALTQRAPADGFAGTSTQFSTLKIALTVETNRAETSSGDSENFNTSKAKIDNKALLAMFADWSGANPDDWRTNGAQLIFDWDTYQLAVADKSGSNILFYAGNGITNGTVQAVCTLDWFNNFGLFDYGAYKEKKSAKNPGTDKWTLNSEGFFELFYDDSSDPAAKIDLYGYGQNAEHYTQQWDQNGAYTKWSEKDTFKPFGAGEKESLNGQGHATVSGVIKANGKGNGRNIFLYTPE